MILAGTGHRPNKLGGYDPLTKEHLIKLTTYALTKYKPDVVISGMALGWDQALATAALNLTIPMHAYIPFEGQECMWPTSSQREYWKLRRAASNVVVCCPGSYSAAKMQVRNCRMVNACTDVLALYDGTPGGTANCIKYAEQQGKHIINTWTCWTKLAAAR